MKNLKRQGDILLVPMKALPENLTQAERDDGHIVLAYGEVTGHKHAIEAETGVELFRAANDNLYLRIVEECFVKHDEHRKVHVLPGLYRVKKQMQWDSNQVRKVLD